MVRVAISAEAFEAITRTLPLGSVGYENKANERGEGLIWLGRAVIDRLCSLRGLGELFSDVILRWRPRNWGRQDDQFSQSLEIARYGDILVFLGSCGFCNKGSSGLPAWIRSTIRGKVPLPETNLHTRFLCIRGLSASSRATSRERNRPRSTHSQPLEADYICELLVRIGS